MEKFGKKQLLVCALAVVITFVLSSVFYIGLGLTYFKNTILGDADSRVLTEVKRCIDALYLEEYDEAALYQGAAKGMTEALDAYSSYYTPAEFENFITAARGAYVGVGLVLTKTKDDELLVLQVYEDSPGEEAGVKAGDVLVSVEGERYDDLDEGASALRGDGSQAQGEGSTVQAVFLREGKERKVTLTRREIHLKTVSARMEENGVAYFKIIAFDEDTDVEFKAAYEELKKKGITKLVLDLRDNGGGDYYSACGLAGLFLKEGETIVYRKDKTESCVYEYAKGHCIDEPVVVLANGNSASASEVFIGALRGNDRLHALVGTKTFGKGITQDVFALRSGGGMSITVSKYYTPDDQCIHGIGFTPDTVVESGFEEDYPVEAIEREKDVQLDKALEIANGIE